MCFHHILHSTQPIPLGVEVVGGQQHGVMDRQRLLVQQLEVLEGIERMVRRGRHALGQQAEGPGALHFLLARVSAGPCGDQHDNATQREYGTHSLSIHKLLDFHLLVPSGLHFLFLFLLLLTLLFAVQTVGGHLVECDLADSNEVTSNEFN